jgi:hypothetical protein
MEDAYIMYKKYLFGGNKNEIKLLQKNKVSIMKRLYFL